MQTAGVLNGDLGFFPRAQIVAEESHARLFHARDYEILAAGRQRRADASTERPLRASSEVARQHLTTAHEVQRLPVGRAAGERGRLERDATEDSSRGNRDPGE